MAVVAAATAICAADIPNDRGHEHGDLRVDTDPLPEGCYEVERLVARRYYLL